MTVYTTVASDAAVSQIWAAIRRLNCKRVEQPGAPKDGTVYVDFRMHEILGGILYEITPVLEAFTRGEAQAALLVLVSQGKISLEKRDQSELYTLKVCSAL